ncbi:MAG: hypothetical protein KAS98_04775, partial [Deltaproteobacteria bacterium]|nr:hypothetical protein [Deltaproteobacteria bacterium]
NLRPSGYENITFPKNLPDVGYSVGCDINIQKKGYNQSGCNPYATCGGADETRTRDLRRDRRHPVLHPPCFQGVMSGLKCINTKLQSYDN